MSFDPQALAREELTQKHRELEALKKSFEEHVVGCRAEAAKAADSLDDALDAVQNHEEKIAQLVKENEELRRDRGDADVG